VAIKQKEYYRNDVTLSVTFENPVQAEKAWKALEGQIFAGRIVSFSLFKL
jgi:hypothetical protein